MKLEKCWQAVKKQIETLTSWKEANVKHRIAENKADYHKNWNSFTESLKVGKEADEQRKPIMRE